MRPRLLVAVTGTGTEVGKTWVSCRLLEGLQRLGLSVAARKPAQSFVAGSATDAESLAAASGESASVVCPSAHSYPLAMAPPMAAEALGLSAPTIEQLAEEIDASWPQAAVAVGLIEGAGGVASPLGADGDTAGLIRRIRADVVVLIADPDLGVINLIRLTRLALGSVPVVVHLNRFDHGQDLHLRNRDWLTGHEGLTVTTSIDDLVAVISGEGGPWRCG